MAEEQKTLSQRISDAIYFEDAQKAFEVYEEINNLLHESINLPEDQKKKLDTAMAKLEFISIRFLDEKVVEKLFLEHTQDILGLPDDINLWETILTRLRTELFLEEKVALKELIKKSIQHCEKDLTTSVLTLGQAQVRPTVENWIKLFTAEVGSELPTNIKMARFYSETKAFQDLSTDDKKKIKRLIELYRKLFLAPDSIEGYDSEMLVEQEDGNIVHVSQEGVEPIYDKESIEEFVRRAEAGELSALELAELQGKFPEIFDRFKRTDSTPESFPLSPAFIQSSLREHLNELAEQFQSTPPANPKDQSLQTTLKKVLGIASDARTIDSFEMVLLNKLQDPASLQSMLTSNDLSVLISTYGAKYLPKEIEKNQSVIMQFLLKVLYEELFGLADEHASWRAYLLLQQRQIPQYFKTIVTYDVRENKLVWRY